MKETKETQVLESKHAGQTNTIQKQTPSSSGSVG